VQEAEGAGLPHAVEVFGVRFDLVGLHPPGAGTGRTLPAHGGGSYCGGRPGAGSD